MQVELRKIQKNVRVAKGKKVKVERNQAQDELVELRKLLEISEDESLKDYVLNMKNVIDNQ